MAPRRKDLEAENEELWQRLEDLYDRLASFSNRTSTSWTRMSSRRDGGQVGGAVVRGRERSRRLRNSSSGARFRHEGRQRGHFAPSASAPAKNAGFWGPR